MNLFLLNQPAKGREGDKILKYQLKNGLTVILQENHASPVVAINIWVNAGSADEKDKEAGISHVFEHMLFKGTEKRPVGMIAQEVEGAGGIINAFTSYDNTVYYLVLASRFFDTGLDILADAIQHSSFDPVELEKEKEVVLEEWRRSQDIPSSVLSEKLFQTAYQKHPYRRPIIGYEDTIKSFTREQMLNFFKKWYIPNNMVLVIVGDFDSELVKPKIEEAFKDFAPGPSPQRNRPLEPPQEQPRTILLSRNINEAYLDLSFHISSIKSKDIYPLDVLALILGQGDSSRLFHRIKTEKQLVHSISAYSYLPRDPGVLIIGATLDPQKSLNALEEILKETYRLRYEEISPEELEKAKINLESDFIYQGETVQGQARKLGYFETLTGNINFQEEYLKGISEVTPEDIMRVANTYLRNTNLTVGLLVPEKDSAAIKEADMRAVLQKADIKKPSITTQEPEPKSQIREEKVVLDNGITLLVKENHTTPIVAMQAVFLGGLRYENKNNNGICNFVASMLTKGTKNRTALEIATDIESIAGDINGFSGQNSFGVTAKVLKRYFAEGLDLLADVLINPTFPAEELEKKRQDILAALKRQEDELAFYTNKIFLQTLYQKHPYGMDILGSEDSIKKLTRQDLIDFYTRYGVAENLVIAIVGDVNRDLAKEKVEKLFKDFPQKKIQPPNIIPESPPNTIRIKEINKEKSQAHIMLGFLGTTITDNDRYALEVLNAILSGQGGRLFLELRDKKSLAYVVGSFSREGIDPGYLGVYIATAPEKVKEAIKGIKEELKKVITSPVSEEELARAKKYLIGTYEIGLQSNASQASDLALNEAYGLGYDFYRHYPQKLLKVTVQDVFRVAKKYIDLDRYVMAIIQPKNNQ
jgi:zinc protease